MWNSSIIIHPHNTHSINIQSIWVISYLLIDVVIVNSHSLSLSLSLSLVCFDTSSLLLFTQHAKVSINYYLWTLVKCKCPTICLISFRSSIDPIISFNISVLQVLEYWAARGMLQILYVYNLVINFLFLVHLLSLTMS